MDDAAVRSTGKKDALKGLVGCNILDLGPAVFKGLLEVFPLRSLTTGRRNSDIFPLPTSKEALEDLFPDFDGPSLLWMCSICISLNCLWGGHVRCAEPPNVVGGQCLALLGQEVERLQTMTGTLEDFSWGDF